MQEVTDSSSVAPTPTTRESRRLSRSSGFSLSCSLPLPLCSYIFRCLLLRNMLRIFGRLREVLFRDLKVVSLRDLAGYVPALRSLRETDVILRAVSAAYFALGQTLLGDGFTPALRMMSCMRVRKFVSDSRHSVIANSVSSPASSPCRGQTSRHFGQATGPPQGETLRKNRPGIGSR